MIERCAKLYSTEQRVCVRKREIEEGKDERSHQIEREERENESKVVVKLSLVQVRKN